MLKRFTAKAIMMNPVQHRGLFCGTRLRAAIGALAMAFVLVATIMTESWKRNGAAWILADLLGEYRLNDHRLR